MTTHAKRQLLNPSPFSLSEPLPNPQIHYTPFRVSIPPVSPSHLLFPQTFTTQPKSVSIEVSITAPDDLTESEKNETTSRPMMIMREEKDEWGYRVDCGSGEQVACFNRLIPTDILKSKSKEERAYGR